jgi:hypothetical protein
VKLPKLTRGRYAADRPKIDGHQFHSLKEAKRYGELTLLAQAGVISNLTVHPALPVKIGDYPFCTYTADFAYVEDGVQIIEEVKSTGTRRDPAYRLRRKAAELFYQLQIRETVR